MEEEGGKTPDERREERFESKPFAVVAVEWSDYVGETGGFGGRDVFVERRKADVDVVCDGEGEQECVEHLHRSF